MDRIQSLCSRSTAIPLVSVTGLKFVSDLNSLRLRDDSLVRSQCRFANNAKQPSVECERARPDVAGVTGFCHAYALRDCWGFRCTSTSSLSIVLESRLASNGVTKRGGSSAPASSSIGRVGLCAAYVSNRGVSCCRVIHLYIAECFPDMETNGVDIFGGWEGAEDTIEALDTADPIVIARWAQVFLVKLKASGKLVTPQKGARAVLALRQYHGALNLRCLFNAATRGTAE